MYARTSVVASLYLLFRWPVKDLKRSLSPDLRRRYTWRDSMKRKGCFTNAVRLSEQRVCVHNEQKDAENLNWIVDQGTSPGETSSINILIFSSANVLERDKSQQLHRHVSISINLPPLAGGNTYFVKLLFPNKCFVQRDAVTYRTRSQVFNLLWNIDEMFDQQLERIKEIFK